MTRRAVFHESGTYDDGNSTLSMGGGDPASATHAASSKATPVDADELPLVDSAASFALKKLTWANLKATGKTYFDTLYAALAHHTQHEAGGSDAIKLDDLAAPDDTTDLDVSTARHGLVPKAPGDTAKFLRGDGTWNTAASGSAAVATDAIWDAKGDLAAATGADAAVKVPVGADYTALYADSSQTAGVHWLPGAPLLLYDYTVSGSDKASIDTGVDTPAAGVAGTAAFPTTFRVLELWLYARTDEAVNISDLDIILNNDTTASRYGTQYIRVVGATVSGINALNTSGHGFNPRCPGANLAASEFGVVRLSIPNYAGRGNFAVGEYTFGATLAAGADTTGIGTFVYNQTTDITRIAVAPFTAGKKLKVGSRLMIYAR